MPMLVTFQNTNGNVLKLVEFNYISSALNASICKLKKYNFTNSKIQLAFVVRTNQEPVS